MEKFELISRNILCTLVKKKRHLLHGSAYYEEFNCSFNSELLMGLWWLVMHHTFILSLSPNEDLIRVISNQRFCMTLKSFNNCWWRNSIYSTAITIWIKHVHLNFTFNVFSGLMLYLEIYSRRDTSAYSNSDISCHEYFESLVVLIFIMDRNTWVPRYFLIMNSDKRLKKVTSFQKIRISYVVQYLNENFCDYCVFKYASVWWHHAGLRIRDKTFVQY
jgi:hypothetical protein